MRDPELTKRARQMRTEMTEPETRLWLQLRAKRFRDVKFRRQKVIQDDEHRYIVDFAANDPRLVVEFDGDTHAGREGYDAVRTRFLESKGYTVVRFVNADVMTKLDGVLVRLEEIVSSLRITPPLPTLSPEGERALEREISLSPSGGRVGERGLQA
jgi:very-short-patch-repair endonuclease